MFERFSERIPQIQKCLIQNNISGGIDEVEYICDSSEIDVSNIVKGIQPIALSDSIWAFKVGVALAIRNKPDSISGICDYIGIGLQSFCILHSIADTRRVGLGHGKLAKKLIDPETQHFAFVAGHESFAAAEGAIGLINSVNQLRSKPVTVSLVGLGKAAGAIISRYKGFNFINSLYDEMNNQLLVQNEELLLPKYNNTVSCFGAHSVLEGVSILEYMDIDLVITGNSTSHIKFTDPTVAIYRKKRTLRGEPFFSVASGGGTGRTMHPDNVCAGAASYGMTDTTGQTHCDLQFAGSSSVPAHVEMVGFIGMGNNPIVGTTISIVNAIAQKLELKYE